MIHIMKFTNMECKNWILSYNWRRKEFLGFVGLCAYVVLMHIYLTGHLPDGKTAFSSD